MGLMSILQNKFSEPGRSAQRRFPLRDRRLLITATVIACVAALALGWYAFKIGGAQRIGGDPPLVHAAEGPAKIRPPQPGGLSVPDQEIMVYDVIEPSRASRPIERLLPPPEEPMAPTSKPPPSSSAAVTPPAPKPEPKVTPSQPPTLETDTSGYRIQLGAFSSSKAAKKQWQNLRRKHDRLLESLEPQFARVERTSPDGGVLVRIQAGPLTSETKARTLCAELKKRGVDCLVVNP